MKKAAKSLVKEAEARGYELVNKSDKFLTYEHPAGHRIHICPSTDEGSAAKVRRLILSQVGEPSKSNKRNTEAIRARDSRRRDQLKQEREQNALRRSHLESQRNGIPASRLNDRLAIEAQIEASYRRERELDQLMREVPASAEHLGRGRARHQAGAA